MSITIGLGEELLNTNVQVHTHHHPGQTTTLHGLVAAVTAEAVLGEVAILLLLHRREAALLTAEDPEVQAVQLQVHHQVQVVEEGHVVETDQ
jgi:hypothetical protein